MARDTAPLTSHAPLPRIDVARHAAHQKNSRSGFRRGRRPRKLSAGVSPAAGHGSIVVWGEEEAAMTQRGQRFTAQI